MHSPISTTYTSPTKILPWLLLGSLLLSWDFLDNGRNEGIPTSMAWIQMIRTAITYFCVCSLSNLKASSVQHSTLVRGHALDVLTTGLEVQSLEAQI